MRVENGETIEASLASHDNNFAIIRSFQKLIFS